MNKGQLLVLLLAGAVALSGTACTSMIDAELGLVDQSREGVALVRQSVEQRQQNDLRARADERRRLDDAFDADVSANVDDLNTSWVMEARRAYAEAVDALSRRDAAAAAAIRVDLDNLDSIKAALDQIEQLNLKQKNLLLQLENKK